MVPFLGHGVGLRTKHFPDLLEQGRRADWFEVITENFLNVGGRPRAVLEAVRRDRPVVLHGVSLSVGSVDPLDTAYLRDVRALAEAVEPAWVSDHLCWGTFGRHNAHDLLPLPFTEESLAHVVSRVSEVQEQLGRRILLENVSSFLTYASSSIPEWDFLAEAARRTTSAASRWTGWGSSTSRGTRTSERTYSTPTTPPCPTRSGRCTAMQSGALAG